MRSSRLRQPRGNVTIHSQDSSHQTGIEQFQPSGVPGLTSIMFPIRVLLMLFRMMVRGH